jgi:hypothetical protein
MATLAELRDRIADELARPDLGPQIARAVTSAIRHYRRRQFNFNEGRTVVMTTPDTEFYRLDDMRRVDTIQRQAGGFPLRRVSAEAIEYLQTGQVVGEPTDWSWHGNVLRFYPRPNAIYALAVLGQTLEEPPSDPAYAGGWVNDAEELIRHRAKADVLANYIRENPEELALARAQEREALVALLGDRALAGTGTIRGYYL